MQTFIEIRYEAANGPVHSDEVFESKKLPKETIRQFFEEWLEKSNGSGYFIVGNPKDLEGDVDVYGN